MWMNEYDVEAAVRDFDPAEVPNLAAGAQALAALVEWTNSNSDGWPYWPKPAQAAKRLMDLLSEHTYAARFGYYQGTAERLHDVTSAELTAALRPVRTFMSKHSASLSV